MYLRSEPKILWKEVAGMVEMTPETNPFRLQSPLARVDQPQELVTTEVNRVVTITALLCK
jgi:hypothetical protein